MLYKDKWVELERGNQSVMIAPALMLLLYLNIDAVGMVAMVVVARYKFTHFVLVVLFCVIITRIIIKGLKNDENKSKNNPYSHAKLF